MESRKIIGIDLGGTKVHVAIIQNGNIIQEEEFATTAHAPQQEIIKDLIDKIAPFATQEVAGIGIGVPGLIDEEKGIVYDLNNIPAWKHVQLKHELEKHLLKPVYVTNDANCFVLGEKLYGEAKAYRNVVGLALGTGFGGGIIIDHKLYSGVLSSAGEIGGVPYLDKTIEDYCSGKFFQDHYGLTGKTLMKQAEAGDSKSLQIFEEFGRHLGNAVKIVLFVLSPDAIFLGGSICKAYPYFKDMMLETVSSFPFKGVTGKLAIQPSNLKHSAVLGAAALFEMQNQKE